MKAAADGDENVALDCSCVVDENDGRRPVMEEWEVRAFVVSHFLVTRLRYEGGRRISDGISYALSSPGIPHADPHCRQPKRRIDRWCSFELD